MTIWLRMGFDNDLSRFYTVWKQCHDPITAITSGSDYTWLAGPVSLTCSGFNGLHVAGASAVSLQCSRTRVCISR
jgi:hypothetical protein